MRTEGKKRKAIEEEEESLLKKAVKYLQTLERAEAKKESEETQEVVELAEAWKSQGDTLLKEGGDFDPEQVRHGREEGINCMVKTLGMFGVWFA